MYMASHYLRKWREHRNLTLEQVADQFATMGDDLPTTHASLSRIERGLQPYNQVILEALAVIYRTDPASLIMRDPGDPDGIWVVWDQAKPREREQIVEIAKTLIKTGR